MIVAMAGLPGAGKSTLARALAPRLAAVVLDKDRIRDSLFAPSHVDYTRDQDDFCVDVMYRTTRWLMRRDPAMVVILDGRNYARADQIATLLQLAADLDEPLRVIECTCDDEIALARIEEDRAAGRHPAANRDAALYRKLQAAADPISQPKLVVDTGRSIADCVADCLAHFRRPGRGASRA
ncbi:MAG: AAA family ATPase [Pseudonocardiaceae bacterium]